MHSRGSQLCVTSLSTVVNESNSLVGCWLGEVGANELDLGLGKWSTRENSLNAFWTEENKHNISDWLDYWRIPQQPTSWIEGMQTWFTIIFSELNHNHKSRLKMWFDWLIFAQNTSDLFAHNHNHSLILWSLQEALHCADGQRPMCGKGKIHGL